MQDTDEFRAPTKTTCVTGVKLVKSSTSNEQNSILDRLLSQQGNIFGQMEVENEGACILDGSYAWDMMVHLAFHLVVGRGTKEHRWILQEYGLRLHGISHVRMCLERHRCGKG